MAESASYQFTDISKISDANHLSKTMENLPLDDLPNLKNDENIDEEQTIIRDALNRQTLIQYRQYAMEQFPKEFTKQEELIVQLQTQHFKNYWENVHLEMIRHQEDQFERKSAIWSSGNDNSNEKSLSNEKDLQIERFPLIPAQLWTMKDIVEFKAEILKNNRSHCIKISSLSTATIKIPTYPDGHRLFWEFATDFYDIGFGLYFEWNMNPGDKIEVSITESSDDEETDEHEEADKIIDEEKAPPRKESIKSVNNDPNKAPVDELITVYRRESHMEVYCGSHEYPGVGYYIQSNSLFRGIWLQFC